MSLLNPVPREQLGTKFKFYGWFCGLVPVYIDDAYADAPMLVERNWVPVLWFMLIECLYGALIFFATIVNPDYEPMWPIMVTGRIGP